MQSKTGNSEALSPGCRPHLVALNKMDLPDAADLEQEITAEIQKVAAQLQVNSLS